MLTPYLQLTKARLSLLVLLTTVVGFVLGAQTGDAFPWLALLGATVGTACAAGAANGFNQVIESARDARMVRTADRPIPSGRMTRRHATIVCTVMSVLGIALMLATSGLVATALAAGTIVLYAAVYTPMKVRSPLNTLVGAVCGATPPLIGWAAATGSLGPGAWALAALLFVWQIPHFLALAWLLRDDYLRGGYAMLPRFDATGERTGAIVLVTSLMLVPLALSAALIGLAGWVYAVGSMALGLWFAGRSGALMRDRSDRTARRAFLASIAYLAGVMALLLLDQGPLPAFASVAWAG